MKRRTWIAVVSGLLVHSFAVAQTDSHFDLSGNMSFNGMKLANAPSSSTQVNTFGWQTTGVTHLNRWLGLTSQFGSSYASSNAITLLGYTGPGKATHYQALAGPRITFAGRSRVNPFVEGLVGADRASTDLTSNGVVVAGREVQLAYGVGGGAQIGVSRHFGLNFEAQYLTTQHTMAFTGWEPESFEASAGVVIRMFARGPQIAEQRRSSRPMVMANRQPAPVQPAPRSLEPPASTPSTFASIQSRPAVPIMQSEPQPPVSIAPVEYVPVHEQTVASVPAAPPAPVPAPVPVATAVAASASVVAPAPVAVPAPVATPAPAVTVAPVVAQPVMSAKVVAPAPPVRQPQQLVQRTAAPAPVVASAAAPAPAPRPVAQAQPQAPLSLGEYARRLREQKQRERQQQQQ
ncbi:MAG TPA: outer membrane beta-barrel protein [Terriglobales bacterium]|nr:outer membrane beta-barrel protein [Terriglobales bacterium]